MNESLSCLNENNSKIMEDMENAERKNLESSYTGDLTDEYHYTKSGEYTSEVFKVVVQNLPKNMPYGRLRHIITSVLGFTPRKIKYNPNHDYAFLCCKNEEDRQKSIDLLNNHQLKDNTLICKKAGPAADPFVKSRKRKAGDNTNNDSKKLKNEEDDEQSPEERILHVVCPYATYTYDEQIQKKMESMQDCIKALTKRFKSEIGRNCNWLNERRECLELMPILKSPMLNNYRNKVEFTIGVGPDNVDNTIGFRLGSYKEGSMLIVDPVKCINCTKESLTIAKEFQSFIQSLSYPSFNIGNHIGLWQQLTVRTYTTGDVMMIVQLFPSFVEDKTEYDELIGKIKTFSTSEERTVKITSVYISSSSSKNNNIDVFDHVCGEKYVHEILLGLKFQISPDSFFQVNTAAAEVLYQTVRGWCDTEQNDSCVLDICCGTGTIGLCIAQNSTIPVIGVEICQQAVDDAKGNAKRNGVENAKFICGPAEKVLYPELKRISKKNIIAVVDPPRAGLHRKVLSMLRSCSAIQKVIYVSCSPKQAADNFVSLCRPASKRFHGTPFKTTRAIPVDLFPHSPHCELIVELVRVTSDVPMRVENTVEKLEGDAQTADTTICAGDKPAPICELGDAVTLNIEPKQEDTLEE